MASDKSFVERLQLLEEHCFGRHLDDETPVEEEEEEATTEAVKSDTPVYNSVKGDK